MYKLLNTATQEISEFDSFDDLLNKADFRKSIEIIFCDPMEATSAVNALSILKEPHVGMEDVHTAMSISQGVLNHLLSLTSANGMMEQILKEEPQLGTVLGATIAMYLKVIECKDAETLHRMLKEPKKDNITKRIYENIKSQIIDL